MSDTLPDSLTTSIVIFGASGDLTFRKLIPALFRNWAKHRLPAGTRIVGVARRDWTNEFFRNRLEEGVKQFGGGTYDKAKWAEFSQRLTYIRGDLSVPGDYVHLDAALRKMEKEPVNRLYYLATAPAYYGPACDSLGAAGMTGEAEGWRRIIIEKPFGTDLASAHQLTGQVHAAFREDQVYRIDHYLGKETAQNILFLRFANTIFEPIWNRRYVANIQITVAETVDVGTRAGYYDTAGVLRDMFQNHLLQLLALIAMEPPASLGADEIRNERAKVLMSIRPLDLANTVRAQYDGYRESDGVAPQSETPTFAALKLYIDNWRWKGIPFYLRSGKALTDKSSSIIVQFQPPPDIMFNLSKSESFSPNMLSICVDPNERIDLRFETKVPDSQHETRTVKMAFQYEDAFGGALMPDAYERLLLDALKGDASLFTRSDGIEQAWRLLDPVLAGWRDTPDVSPLQTYAKGSWGPEAAHQLLTQAGHEWRLGCGENGCPL